MRTNGHRRCHLLPSIMMDIHVYTALAGREELGAYYCGITTAKKINNFLPLFGNRLTIGVLVCTQIGQGRDYLRLVERA